MEFFSDQRLKSMLDTEINVKTENSFSDWWIKHGSYIDPEPSVSWEEKRRDLCQHAWEASQEHLKRQKGQ